MLCPHGVTVTLVQTFGISTYAHDTGQACEMMNDFRMTATKILLAYALNPRSSQSVARGALLSSRQVRAHFFKSLALVESDEEVVFMFRRWEEATGANEEIFREIFMSFGATAVANCRTLGIHVPVGIVRDMPHKPPLQVRLLGIAEVDALLSRSQQVSRSALAETLNEL